MQRSRTGLLVLAGALAVTGLAGCRTQPGAAAFVADARFSENQVEAIVDSIDTDLRASVRPDGLPVPAYANVRRTVVQLQVFIEVARRYAAEKGYSVPPTDYANWASQIGLPADNPFVHLIADANTYRDLLTANVTPVTPSEDDMRDAFGRITRAVPNAGSYEQLRPQLEQAEQMRRGVSLRNELNEAVKRYQVSVSPRYQPLELPVATVAGPSGEEIILVGVALNGRSAPVVGVDEA